MTAVETAATGTEPPNNRYAPLLIVLTMVMIAVLTVFFIVFQYATVSGPSMRPSLVSDDRLLLTRGYPVAHRGDIVVFNWTFPSGPEEVVKRVVGLPGDVVVMQGDVAWVNGVREPSDHQLITAAADVPFGPAKVPDGTLFVLGDNRPVSLDSRFIGFVPLNMVKGRAVAVFSPVDRMRLVPGGK